MEDYDNKTVKEKKRLILKAKSDLSLLSISRSERKRLEKKIATAEQQLSRLREVLRFAKTQLKEPRTSPARKECLLAAEHRLCVALTFAPKEVNCNMLLGDVYLESKQFKKAVGCLQAVLDICSKNNQVWASLGKVYLVLK